MLQTTTHEYYGGQQVKADQREVYILLKAVQLLLIVESNANAPDLEHTLQ